MGPAQWAPIAELCAVHAAQLHGLPVSMPCLTRLVYFVLLLYWPVCLSHSRLTLLVYVCHQAWYPDQPSEEEAANEEGAEEGEASLPAVLRASLVRFVCHTQTH